MLSKELSHQAPATGIFLSCSSDDLIKSITTAASTIIPAKTRKALA
jgi:hypothetical protein